MQTDQSKNNKRLPNMIMMQVNRKWLEFIDFADELKVTVQLL